MEDRIGLLRIGMPLMNVIKPLEKGVLGIELID